jgi:hypothetical protein
LASSAAMSPYASHGSKKDSISKASFSLADLCVLCSVHYLFSPSVIPFLPLFSDLCFISSVCAFSAPNQIFLQT